MYKINTHTRVYQYRYRHHVVGYDGYLNAHLAFDGNSFNNSFRVLVV